MLFLDSRVSPKRRLFLEVQLSKNRFHIHVVICFIHVTEEICDGVGWHICHISVRRARKKLSQPMLCCVAVIA